MECVAYMRVSTEKQAEEGNGLDSQKRDILNYARKNELIVSDWYIDDGYTGANMDRPQLQRLINDCSKKRVKCVIAFKLDRISRSMIDGIYMIERVFIPNGIDFKCVHDSVSYESPMEQAYTQMMAVFAQLDKNTMLLRMRGGMLERVKQGYWMGGGNLPYCYSYDRDKGILVPIEHKAEQAKKAIKLFNQGYSDLRIQQMLGFKNEAIVRKILTSVVNIGMIPYKGEIYKGLHEPIFSHEEFQLAQQNRKIRSEVRSYARTEPNMLTGLCYCGVCGCKMRYQKWGKSGHRIYCLSRNRDMGKKKIPNWNPDCKNELVWADEIEYAVEKEILKISMTLSRDNKAAEESRYEMLRKNIDREKSKLKRLYGLYADGNDTVLDMIKEQEEHIKSMQEEMQKEYLLEEKKPDREIVYEKIKTLADVWKHIDKQEKNKILKIIISKIIIVNGKVDIILRNY